MSENPTDGATMTRGVAMQRRRSTAAAIPA
jgi:hypothetical protein